MLKKFFAKSRWCLSIILLFISQAALADDATTLQLALNAAKANNVLQLAKLRNLSKDADLRKLINWLYLKADDTTASFEEISNFIEQNPQWPNRNRLIFNAEKQLDFTLNSKTIKDWCIKHAPISGNAYKVCEINNARLIQDNKAKCEYLRNAWVHGNYKNNEDLEFINKYSKCLKPVDYTERVERLLWDDKISAAKKLTKYLNPYGKKLLDSFIAIKAGKIPELDLDMQTNDLILFELVKLNNKRNHFDRVDDLIIQAKDVVNPEKWWPIRNLRAREAISNKNYSLAYRLVKHHSLDEGKEFVDAEWLAGWVSYSFLKDYKTAATHFVKLYKNSKFTMSKIRAAYWLGLAKQKLGQEEESKKWLEIAAKHPEIFYGQMALLKLGHKQFKLPDVPKITDQDIVIINKNELYRISMKLLQAKAEMLSKSFMFEALSRVKDAKQAYLITKMPVEKFQLKYIGVEVAKEAGRHGFVFTDIGYPKLKDNKNFLVENEWVMAIIRQESNFNTNAKSSAGALGYMQLLPNVAKQYAKKLGVEFNVRKLNSDPTYNVFIGQYYLYQLENLYDGNYVLAIMSYDAGMGNIRKWLANMGNPSKLRSTEAVINWIESAPFSETRNYVLRVLENLQMYRALSRPNQKMHKIFLAEDLLSADNLVASNQTKAKQ